MRQRGLAQARAGPRSAGGQPASSATKARRTSCGLPSTSALTCVCAASRAVRRASGSMRAVDGDAAIACVSCVFTSECSEVARRDAGDRSDAHGATFWALCVAVLLRQGGGGRAAAAVRRRGVLLAGRPAPGAAYSDLPGLTAWLTRLGVERRRAITHWRCVRRSCCSAALVPWLVARIAAREFGAAARLAGRHASRCCCRWPARWACWRCRTPHGAGDAAVHGCRRAAAARGRRAARRCELALGLAMGALSHYRFIAVIGVGLVALLLLPRRPARAARRARVDRDRVRRAGLGAAAGVEPATTPTPACASSWSIAIRGRSTPTACGSSRSRPCWSRRCCSPRWRWPAGAARAQPVAGVALFRAAGRAGGAGFLRARLLRRHRAGQLPLAAAGLPGAAAAAAGRCWRAGRAAGASLTWARRALGLAVTLGYYVAVSMPELRAQCGRGEVVSGQLRRLGRAGRCRARGSSRTMPPGTRMVADNFKIGAELGFALGDAGIPVLDHPLNHKHGRAPQLALWGLQTRGRERLGRRAGAAGGRRQRGAVQAAAGALPRAVRSVGPLPPPRVLNIDHGRQRFLLFALDGAPCATGAVHDAGDGLDRRAGATAQRRPPRSRSRAGRSRTASASRASRCCWTASRRARRATARRTPASAAFWQISTDPQHPAWASAARVDLGGITPGRHWLGLRLHGATAASRTGRSSRRSSGSTQVR